MTNIAFIGLGNMGAGMCANLAKAGHSVIAFDIDPAAISAARDNGAHAAPTAAKAVIDADFVVTMLPTGAHVLDVYFGSNGVCSNAREGAVLIDCSTISVDEARIASTKAQAAGFNMIDAPVSGGVASAMNGSLTFMVGGEKKSVDRSRPILECMGNTIVWAGGPGNGQAAKIANNMLLGVSMMATCEAFELARRLGLDAQTFFEISSRASGQNWSMTSYCPVPGPVPASPANRDYEAGFAVDMMLKDLRLAERAAEGADATTPLSIVATQAYQSLSSDGHGQLDFSVMLERIAGCI